MAARILLLGLIARAGGWGGSSNEVSKVAVEPLTVANAEAVESSGKSRKVQVHGHVAEDTAENPAFLELSVRVNGAIAHRQVEHLCRLKLAETSGNNMASAMRRCEFAGPSGGSFDATSIVYVPKATPSVHNRPAIASQTDAELEESVFKPAWAACSDRKAEMFPGQVAHTDMKILYRRLLQAVRTLPIPFTMLESGNLCGQSTIFLAHIKRKLCPTCRFMSLDPGYFRHVPKFAGHAAKLRKRYGANFTMQDCTKLNIEAHGLSSEVELYDAFGQEAPLFRPPIVCGSEAQWHGLPPARSRR